MQKRLAQAIFVFVIGGLYWQLVSEALGVSEPWDASAYWTLAYPVSLILSVIGGLILKSEGWLAGIMLTFAQLPVIWINNGTGPLWAVGLIFLSILAIPAVAISILSGRIAARHQHD